jgi:outer membrane protein OmpU
MKNILLASTALVIFAGTAVADVAITGRAEMGIFSADSVGAPTTVNNVTTFATVGGITQFFTDIDVTFTMSGETDNGLTFGASVDLDEGGAGAAAVANNADDGGATIFISGGFGTLTMGDTDGALDWAMTDIGNIRNPGSIADDETSHGGYVGAYLDGKYDGQILRYDYSFGDFGVAVSVEQDDHNALDDGFAVGVKYSMDMGGVGIDFGLGYQEVSLTTTDDLDALGLSVVANFGDFSAGINYVESSSTVLTEDGEYLGFGVGYSANGLSVHANYSQIDATSGLETDGYGLAVAYDLGGGASVHGGYGSSSSTQPGFVFEDLDRWSLGLGLSF